MPDKQDKTSMLQNTALIEVLDRARAILESFGHDYSDDCSQLRILRGRLKSGRFHMAVLGQFKRGKSTLLNALLGDDLLPTDILPVTAIPTFIEFAEEMVVKVHFENTTAAITFSPTREQPLSDFLGEYVTESGNPYNQRQVSRVEIGYPAEILQQGVVLIDTPGIGSTHQHNTELAYRVLPQCDAALFLFSPDPPITAVELDYLKEIQQHLPRTFYLLNKIDFLDEKERVSSLSFLAQQLTPVCDGGVPQVLPVSGRKALRARLEGNNEGWKESGMWQVEQGLIDFFSREKQLILHESIRRHTCDQLSNINMQLQLSLKALMLPEAELKQRIEQFSQSLPEVEREKQTASDILAGDLKRVVDCLSAEVEAVRSRAKEKLLPQMESYFDTIADIDELERLVSEMLAKEVPLIFTPAMREVAARVTSKATEILSLHQQRGDHLIEQVRKIAAESFDLSCCAPTVERSYVGFEMLSWTNDLFTSAMDPLGQRISQTFFSYRFRRKKTVKRLCEGGVKIVNQNVEQMRWSLRREVDEGFRTFGAELSEQLERTITATRQAMEVALQRTESQGDETAERELQLKRALNQLQGLLADLGE